jgi:hypothetical protein
MSLREKGFCPGCGMYTAIRKDGTIWGHDRYKGNDIRPVKCDGSGKAPKVMK